MFAIRFIKEIFVEGNLSFFSELDPSIEEDLYKIATYNSKPKKKKEDEKNRGENYFVETMSVSKNEKSKTMGNTYVLLAT